MEIKNIESFFLNTLLRVALAGVFLIFASDLLLYPEDRLSLTIDVAILAACGVSYLTRVKYQTSSVIILTTVVLATMIYQSVVVPVNTTASLSVILIVGFIISSILKGAPMWAMHVICFACIQFIFIYQFLNPDMRFSKRPNDLVTVMITYTILYFILTYTTAILKASYDKIHHSLKLTNDELHQKATEISAQNEELLQIQDNLNALNTDLERIVNERTAKIQAQNETLLLYSYRNAHHLRGPLARLLGLASLYKLEPKPDAEFIIQKMVDQAHEIDVVVNQINVELEERSPDGEPSTERLAG